MQMRGWPFLEMDGASSHGEGALAQRYSQGRSSRQPQGLTCGLLWGEATCHVLWPELRRFARALPCVTGDICCCEKGPDRSRRGTPMERSLTWKPTSQSCHRSLLLRDVAELPKLVPLRRTVQAVGLGTACWWQMVNVRGLAVSRFTTGPAGPRCAASASVFWAERGVRGGARCAYPWRWHEHRL